jgi:hypothetical protein
MDLIDKVSLSGKDYLLHRPCFAAVTEAYFESGVFIGFAHDKAEGLLIAGYLPAAS